jgi:hypothetical protein
MLDMCLVTRVFLQANSCLISKMKRVRHKRVKHVNQRRNIVCDNHHPFLITLETKIPHM